MEDTLWNMGLLADSDPRKLLDTMVYVFGLHFALRGRDEHRRLRPSQLTVRTAADGRRYIEYREDVSKTRTGGLKSFKRPLKVTQAFELPDCRQRCPVRLFELYNARCPPDRPVDAFYLSPLEKCTADRWFTCVPIGVNTLGAIVANLCKRAGFVGFYSNHSLQATAATRLFSADVDEQLIKLKTGHSSDAVRSYKTVSEEQLTDVITSKRSAPEQKNIKLACESVIAVTNDTANDAFGGLFTNCQITGSVNINVSYQ